jgi:NMD protein affecting ribosome stability and mRNA decay
MIYTNSRYYEGILQIRPNNKMVLNYVKNEIEKEGNVFISREVYKKFGTDLYLTNKFFLMQLGRKLKQKFHGIVKRSRSLYKTHRLTSKLVYRTTICFRLIEENSTKDL